MVLNLFFFCVVILGFIVNGLAVTMLSLLIRVYTF